MTTNLPALDTTTHVASVTYACTFGLTTVSGGLVTFLVPQPVQFNFAFETGKTQPDPDVDLFDITVDSSWFDQAATEAKITSALDTICAAIAALIGVTTADIQGTVTIKRTWRINPNQVGTASPVQIPAAPVPYTEIMAYPLNGGAIESGG
jgi:hypothetical protein